MWMQDALDVKSTWSRLDSFKNHLLEVGLTQNWETMALRTLTTVALFRFIMCGGPAWKKFIQIAFGWGLHANIPHSSGSLRVHQTPQRAQVFFKFLLGKLGCNLWKAPLNWDIVYWARGVLWLLHITRIILLKYFSIWLWGIDNTLQNISHIQIECEGYSIQ